MKADEAKKLTDNALAELAAALEQGKSEALTRYLGMLARFHRYSFGNVMLILAQRADATQVAGFHTWKSLGRFVKKGEKGIAIIAPMVLKSRDEAAAGARGEEGKTILRFRAVHVFDASQTDGEPLPEPTQVGGDPGPFTERVKLFIAAKSIGLDYADEIGGALGVSRGGRITVRSGLTPAEEFSVLVHELAHELLHRGEDRKSTSKTVRETEAEAVAFVVGRAIGLETGNAASDYIQIYDGDKNTLADSLDRIQHVAAEILSAIQHEPALELEAAA